MVLFPTSIFLVGDTLKIIEKKIIQIDLNENLPRLRAAKNSVFLMKSHVIFYNDGTKYCEHI